MYLRHTGCCWGALLNCNRDEAFLLKVKLSKACVEYANMKLLLNEYVVEVRRAMDYIEKALQASARSTESGHARLADRRQMKLQQR